MTPPGDCKIHGRTPYIEICGHLAIAYNTCKPINYTSDFFQTYYCMDCAEDCGFNQLPKVKDLEDYEQTLESYDELHQIAYSKIPNRTWVCKKCFQFVLFTHRVE